jgi:hypothetical protein
MHDTYITDALFPFLGTFTSCSEYVGHLFVIEFLGVSLPFHNLANLQFGSDKKTEDIKRILE